MLEFQAFISPASPSVQTLGLFQQISSLSTVRALDVPVFGATSKAPNYAIVQAETQNVRYRDDGLPPTAAVGLLLIAGDPPTKFTGNLGLLKFIEATASAKLNVRYY